MSSSRESSRGNGRLERGEMRRRSMRMANDESAHANRNGCPCGSAFCCNGTLLDFQQYVERLYWSNPLPEPLELMELVPRRMAGFEPERSLLRDVLDAVSDVGDGKEKGNKPDDKVEEASGDNCVEEEGGYQGDVQKEAEKVDDQEGKEKEVANINSDANEKNDEIGDSRDPSLSVEPMDILETVCSSSSPPPLLEAFTNDSDSILKMPEDEHLRKDDDGLKTGPPDLQRENNSDDSNYYLDSSMWDSSFYNDIGSQPPSPMYMGDVADSARFSGRLPSLSPIHGIAEVKQEIMTDDEEDSEYISGGGVDGDEGRIEEEDRTSPPELKISCFSSGPSMPTLEVEAPVIIWKSSPSPGRPTRTRSMQYQCSTPSCGKRFSRLETMVTHEKEHNLGDLRPFHCKDCNRSYTSKSSFEGHLSRHRFCKKCGNQIKNASVSKKSASNALEEFCDSCRCKYSKAVLVKHLKTDEDSSDADNNGDEDASKSEPPLKKMRRGTDSPIKDSEDNISTEVEDDGQDDAATDVSEEAVEEKEEGEAGEGTTPEIEGNGHSLGTEYQCAECGKVYQKHKWYKMHMLQHQKTEWPCKLCDEILDSKNALTKHKRKNHPSNGN